MIKRQLFVSFFIHFPLSLSPLLQMHLAPAMCQALGAEDTEVNNPERNICLQVDCIKVGLDN